MTARNKTGEMVAENAELPLPIPYSLFPVPYSLFPIPCSLFPIPYSLFPIPYSLFPVPYSLFPVPYSTDSMRSATMGSMREARRAGK